MRAPSRWCWRAVMTCLLTIGLSGCLGISLPTQRHPICSWGSQPPANAAAVCSEVFGTLSALTQAVFKGNTRNVYRLVPNYKVARRIIRFGAAQRHDGTRVLHVVPSIALDDVHPGYIGAGFYLLSESRAGKGSLPETVYLRVRQGRALVVGDQPGQDW